MANNPALLQRKSEKNYVLFFWVQLERRETCQNYEAQARRHGLSVHQNKCFLHICLLIWQSPSGNHQEVILHKFVEWPLERRYCPPRDTADLAQLPQKHARTHSTHSLERELSAVIADKTTETWHRLTREEDDEGNETSTQTQRQTHTHTLSAADTH